MVDLAIPCKNSHIYTFLDIMILKFLKTKKVKLNFSIDTLKNILLSLYGTTVKLFLNLEKMMQIKNRQNLCAFFIVYLIPRHCNTSPSYCPKLLCVMVWSG